MTSLQQAYSHYTTYQIIQPTTLNFKQIRPTALFLCNGDGEGSGPYIRRKTHIQHTHSQHLSTNT